MVMVDGKARVVPHWKPLADSANPILTFEYDLILAGFKSVLPRALPLLGQCVL